MRSIALAFSIAAALLATTTSGLGLRSGFDVDQAVGLTLLSGEQSSTTNAESDPVTSPSPPLPPHLRAAEEEIDGLEQAVASGGGSGGSSSNATANATAVQGRIELWLEGKPETEKEKEIKKEETKKTQEEEQEWAEPSTMTSVPGVRGGQSIAAQEGFNGDDGLEGLGAGFTIDVSQLSGGADDLAFQDLRSNLHAAAAVAGGRGGGRGVVGEVYGEEDASMKVDGANKGAGGWLDMAAAATGPSSGPGGETSGLFTPTSQTTPVHGSTDAGTDVNAVIMGPSGPSSPASSVRPQTQTEAKPPPPPPQQQQQQQQQQADRVEQGKGQPQEEATKTWESTPNALQKSKVVWATKTWEEDGGEDRLSAEASQNMNLKKQSQGEAQRGGGEKVVAGGGVAVPAPTPVTVVNVTSGSHIEDHPSIAFDIMAL